MSDEWGIFAGGSGSYGPWERMSPLMSRRRKPDGTWEVKLTPSFAGGKPGVGKVDQPDTSLGAIAKEAAKTTGTAWMKNLVTMPEQAEAVLALPGAAVRLAASKGPVSVRKDLLGPLVTQKGEIDRLTQSVSGIHQRQTERLADAAQDSPILGTAAYAAAELGAGLLDPTNLPLGAAASRVPRRPLAEAAMSARAGGKTPGVLEALAESAELRPEAGEMRIPDWLRRYLSRHPEIDPDVAALQQDALERIARAEEATAGLPEPSFSPPVPRPSSLVPDEAPGRAMPQPLSIEEMRRPVGHATRESQDAAWRSTQEEGEELARLSLPLGEPPRTLPGAGGSGPGGPIGPQTGAEGPLFPRPPMSTKGITNVAGMQPELQELAADNFDLIYKARGAPRPVSIYHDAKALADQTGLTLDDFLSTPAGRWNDREVALGRSLLGGLRNRIKATADQVAAGTLDPAVGQEALAADRLKLAKLMATLQGQGASEWGRGLRSLQEAVDPLGLASSQGEQLQLALMKRYSGQLDDDSMQKLSMLGDDPESPDLLNFLRAMENPRFNDYRGSYWINSILSGTKTMLRNGIGNAVRLAELTVMRPVDAGVEQILARIQGRTPERYFRETVPAMVGLYRGVPESIHKFAFVMRKGYNPDRLIEDLTGQAGELGAAAAGRLPLDPFLLSKNKAVRAVGVPLTMSSRNLSATDALFRTMGSTSEMYASATRTAIKEGLKGDALAKRAADLLADPTPEMLESARRFAQKVTYTDPMSEIGRWATQGRKMLGPVGDHLLPFIHVSDRVTAAITDYIPGAKPGKLYRTIRDQSPEASELIARQAVGGAIAMMGLSWANQGKLVGAAPKDPDLRNDFYAEGKQPYSLLVAGHWVPIRDAAGPWAGPLVAAIALHDHFQEDPTGSQADQVVEAAGGMALSSASYMLDASYLQTLQDVISSVQEERGGAGRKATQAGTRVVGGYNLFSGLQRGIAGAMDPRVVEKDGPIDELKAGIPGLRQTLPARIGPLGEELEVSTGRAGALSPVVPAKSNIADPQLDERVDRLRYTLQQMRTRFGRVEGKIEATRRGRAGAAGLEDGKAEELAARGAALRGELPAISSPTGAIDQTMDDVRELEDDLRRLRANQALAPAMKREREIAIQLRMQTLLERALGRLGNSAENYSETIPAPADEWDIFAPEPR